MSDQNGSATLPHESVDSGTVPSVDKGKGKATEAVAHDVSMDEDDSSSEEEAPEVEGAEDDDPDSMEEISVENIIADGRRTRGRHIDFAKAAEEHPEEDEEDEEDDDFEEGADEEMED